MEFKVGDRVRVIDNAEEYFGLVGKIESKIMDFMGATYYEVDIGEEFPYTFGGSQLEICVEKEDVKHKIPNELRLENIEQRIEKLEKEIFKPVETHAKPKEPQPSLLTEDERVILRNMNKDFKWIFRDIFNNLIIQKKKPKRVKHRNNEFILEGVYVPLYCYKHLFKFIKFEDKPYNIEELLKGERGNE